jgi:xylulokinase
MTVLLGIDIGTTATKVSVANLEGDVLAERSAPCAIESPEPGWAEADPRQWWDNVCSLVPSTLTAAAVSASEVAAVGVSGMVPAVLCLDEHDEPLSPSIQQNDARAGNDIRELATALAEADLLERTGSGLTSQSVGPKLRWLRRNRPAQIEATRRICGSYDWIITRLTGARATEANWALESGLWDMATGVWADDVLEAVGAERAWFAPVRRSHELVGEVTRDAAAATGLAAGTPVTAGAADHIASAFSAGLVNDGDLLVKLGGAGDIMLSMSERVVDERVFLDHHLLPDAWMLNGCMASSGSVLRWFQRELAGGQPFAELDASAEPLGPGAEGIVCLPYFLGEKSPIQDADARGAFVGLHLGHEQAHLYRAVLEAIAYGFRHHLEVFAERGLQPSRVRVTNGGSRSRLWRQIVADVIGHPLESLLDHPGSGLGSAFAAGVAVELLTWTDIDRFARVAEVIETDAAAHARYEEPYAIYRELYPALAPLAHRLSALQGDRT